MTNLDAYLARYFQDQTQFAAACGISAAQLQVLIHDGLAPAPSYVVDTGTLSSPVFGALPAPGAIDADTHSAAASDWSMICGHA